MPRSVSTSKGSQRLAALARRMRAVSFANVSIPSIANSASAGLNTSRVFVSTPGWAFSAGEVMRSMPVAIEWIQRAFAARAELARMKPSSVLINVGRGALVDEPALVDVLQRGAIRGAALDVFETEPLPAEHPFFGMENVLLSPHCADRTATWLAEALALFFENLTRFRAGAALLHPVDKALGY